MFLLRRSSLFTTPSHRYYNNCRTCIEDTNIFSTTTKITFFNILFTSYLSNCLIAMNYNQRKFEEKLNKKLDDEFAKRS
jgi:hypothetical protein